MFQDVDDCSDIDTKSYSLATTVQKAFRILECIGKNQPVKAPFIVKKLDLTRGNVHRLLITLEALLDTGIITGVVFVLVGAGQALSWFLSFMRLPQQFMPALIGPDPTQLWVILLVVISYFVACMFVDPIVAIYILTPIFAPYVLETGIDPIFLGTLVTLQAAIGSATPPFGCDIFTAQLIFRRPYWEVIKNTPPFILILIIVTILIIMFPGLALWLPNASFIK